MFTSVCRNNWININSQGGIHFPRNRQNTTNNPCTKVIPARCIDMFVSRYITSKKLGLSIGCRDHLVSVENLPNPFIGRRSHVVPHVIVSMMMYQQECSFPSNLGNTYYHYMSLDIISIHCMILSHNNCNTFLLCTNVRMSTSLLLKCLTVKIGYLININHRHIF